MKQSVKLILLALVLFCAYCAKAQDEEATDPGIDAESPANANGTNQVETKRAGRLNGGVQSAIADYPYVVSVIVLDGAGYSNYLAGVIISDTQVLTAASGVVSYVNGIASITIRAGSVYKDQGGFTFPVSKREPHPLYDDTTKENDVAVLTITGSFSGNANVAPITVATSDIPFSTANPAYCVVLGWGKDVSFNEITLLSRVVYKLAADATCAAQFGGTMPASQLCAESVAGYTCYSSIGFPLVCNNLLYGIYPNTDGCTPGIRKFIKAPAASVQSFLAPYLPSATVTASQPAPRKNYVSCP
ncbi:trypsin delta-like [Anopheles aquasalis]|uniref:trypsin delta-like n=1 Tax=Anopheles aquasalis TaxID=42839 RepID=UPI00215A57ED|nr:trypsin delta-like [Anopheles aquasalis]